METLSSIYRDGLREDIVGPIFVYTTREGHTIERYKLTSGETRYFATLAGSFYCAHGDTEAEAIADALWKDESKRPSMEAVKQEIIEAGPNRLITLNEFRLLTGACLVGCKEALRKAGLPADPMKAADIRDKVNREWGEKLISVLGWENK